MEERIASRDVHSVLVEVHELNVAGNTCSLTALAKARPPSLCRAPPRDWSAARTGKPYREDGSALSRALASPIERTGQPYREHWPALSICRCPPAPMRRLSRALVSPIESSSQPTESTGQPYRSADARPLPCAAWLLPLLCALPSHCRPSLGRDLWLGARHSRSSHAPVDRLPGSEAGIDSFLDSFLDRSARSFAWVSGIGRGGIGRGWIGRAPGSGLCSALFTSAPHCPALPRTAPHCPPLPRTAPHCSARRSSRAAQQHRDLRLCGNLGSRLAWCPGMHALASRGCGGLRPGRIMSMRRCPCHNHVMIKSAMR